MADERDSKNEILRRLDMAAVVGEYVVLQHRGGRLWGLCPFHTEKTPSFSVNPDRGMFYCFGCHKGGDLFTFVMEVEKLNFAEALRLLAEKAGVELGRQRTPADDRRDALLELNRRVAGSFAWLLRESRAEEAEAAREYLRGRGFTAETIERFQVGYAPQERGWLAKFLEDKGYSKEFLRASGLFREDGTAFFRGRIMFPIESARGEIRGFGGRAMADGVPKYLNSPETPVFRKREALFGIRQAVEGMRRSGSFLLMEGYTDVMASHQAGVSNAAATLGTSLTEEQIRLLRRYAPKAVLVPDADEAGRSAAIRSLEALEAAGLDVEVVRLPGDLDPADLLREERGAGKLQELLKCPISGFEYFLDFARGRYDSSTPGGKEGIFRLLLPLLRKTSSEVKRDGYFSRLAEVLDVRPESLRRDYGRSGQGGQERAPVMQARLAGTLSPELFMMIAVAANADQYAPLRARDLRLEDLQDPRARQLYVALEECFRAEEQGLRPLLERIEDPDLKALVVEKAASDEFAANPEALIGQAVRWHRRERLEARRQKLVAEMRRAQRESPHEVRRLLEDKMSLDQEIEQLRVKDVGSAE